MLVAKISEKEIKQIRLWFQNIEKIIKKFECSDNPDIEKLTQYLKKRNNLYWEKALFNLETLIDNCCIPNSDILELKPSIKENIVK